MTWGELKAIAERLGVQDKDRLALRFNDRADNDDLIAVEPHPGRTPGAWVLRNTNYCRNQFGPEPRPGEDYGR